MNVRSFVITSFRFAALCSLLTCSSLASALQAGWPWRFDPAQFSPALCESTLVDETHGMQRGNQRDTQLGNQPALDSWVARGRVNHQLPPARIVALTAHDPLQNVYQNLSQPSRWSSLPYGPIEMSIQAVVDQPPTAIRFWLNGQPAHPELLTAQTPWMPGSDDQGDLLYTRNFTWTAPVLGKSNLQVEFQLDGLWSPLSPPIHLEVFPPLAPVLVAAGTSVSGLHPLEKFPGVLVCDAVLMVKLANVPSEASILADVPGYGTIAGEPVEPGLIQFHLSQHLTSGRYRLSFRHAQGDMTSPASAALWIDFHVPTEHVHLDAERATVRRQLVANWKTGTRSALIKGDASHATTSIARQVVHELRHLLKQQALQQPALPVQNGYSVQTKLVNAQDAASEHSTDVVPAHAQAQQVPTAIAAPQADNTDATLSASPSNVSAPSGENDTQLANANDTPAQAILRSLQPVASTITELESIADQGRQMLTPAVYVTDVAFDTPLSFPRRTYGPNAQEFTSSGLTILEDMRLQVAADGSYDFSFRYVPPQLPTQLQLQLQFRTHDGAPWQSLTVAPMDLKTMRDLDRPSSEVTHVIRGHSYVLERSVGQIFEIRRRGAAKFGYGYEGLMNGNRD